MSTLSTPKKPPPPPSIRSQINKALLESGEYERLTKVAKRKFDETGWTEEIKKIANRHLRSSSTLKFNALSDAVKQEAEGALSKEARRDILILVAAAVRQIISEAEDR